MINTVFKIIYMILYKTSIRLKISYKEINIILYYIIIPFTWFIMLSFILNSYLPTIIPATGYLILFLGIKDWSQFCNWLFDKSVLILQFPFNTKKWYVINSVILCVIIPIIIYSILFYSLI